MLLPQSERSVLLITLDSCRYDTFESAAVPHLKEVGTLHRAAAPGNFTYPSHSAIFVGFTPGVATKQEPFVNPKAGRIFRLAARGSPAKGTEHFILHGRNIIEGFRNAGYLTLGTGGVRWLDPSTSTGANLTGSFEHFRFFGYHSLRSQVEWVKQGLEKAGRKRDSFVFVNVGETHVPYWHAGAPWSRDENPCKSSGEGNDAVKCRQRQRACLEFADRELAPLLAAFVKSNIVVCADHGDAWGEEGLWEHSFHHPKVMEVPLLYRLGTAVRPPVPPAMPEKLELPRTFLTPKVIIQPKRIKP